MMGPFLKELRRVKMSRLRVSTTPSGDYGSQGDKKPEQAVSNLICRDSLSRQPYQFFESSTYNSKIM